MVNESKQNEITKIEDVYRKLLHLYERLTSETVTISKQGEIIGKIIEELKAESRLATEFKVQVRSDLTKHINKAVGDTDKQISQAMATFINTGVANSVNDFERATKNGTKVLREYTDDADKRKIWTRGGVGFLGVLCCCVIYITFVLVKRIPNDLVSYQFTTYQKGELFKTLLDKVPKQEYDELMKLAIGELPAKRGSIDWIKKHNPKMSDLAARLKFIKDGYQY